MRGSSSPSLINSSISSVLMRSGIEAGDGGRQCVRWHYQYDAQCAVVPWHGVLGAAPLPFRPQGLCYVPASSSIIQHSMIYSALLLWCCLCTSVVVGELGVPAREHGAAWTGHGGEQARASPCSE